MSRKNANQRKPTSKPELLYKKVLEKRRLAKLSAELQAGHEAFENRHRWKIFRVLHNLRVRWQWLALGLLFVCLVCWVLGLHFFGHVGLALATEQVLHLLSVRAVTIAETVE